MNETIKTAISMDFSPVTRYLEQAKEEYGIPSIDTVIAQDGKYIYRKQLGYSDREQTKPVCGNELYMGYSSTKLYTSAALAMLIDEGKLSLDDPAEAYLPGCGHLTVGVKNDKGEIVDTVPVPHDAMKIRHLATMTGGLTYNTDTPWIREAKAAGKTSTLEILDAILKEPLQFAPGESFSYSLCLDAAAGVVEVVSGMKYSEFLAQRIFRPLGMTDATFRPNEEQVSRLIQQYMHREEGGFTPTDGSLARPITPEFESGGGGLYFTVDDYMKFAMMLANSGTGIHGEKIMSPHAVELMRAPLLTSDAQEKGFAAMHKYGYTYGLGVRTMQNPGPLGLVTPVGEFGWDSAGCIYVSICPEKKLTFFFAMQGLGFLDGYLVLHPTLRELIYKAII